MTFKEWCAKERIGYWARSDYRYAWEARQPEIDELTKRVESLCCELGNAYIEIDELKRQLVSSRQQAVEECI